MTAIADTPFAKLDTEGRLLKPILNADTHVAGRFGYRGDISYDGPETVIKVGFVDAFILWRKQGDIPEYKGGKLESEQFVVNKKLVNNFYCI